MSATLVGSGLRKRQAEIPSVIRQIRKHVDLVRATLLLVGSMARGTETQWSDIDFLVISEGPKPIWTPPVNVHLQFDTRNEFIAGIKRGDDFRAWALRYGKVIFDDGWWLGIPRAELLAVWPVWGPKIAHARRNLRFSMQLVETGDVIAAWREIIYAVSHVARAILLAAHQFPLSRPELAGQLVSMGEEPLADTLKLLLFKEPNLEDVTRIASDLEGRIAHMSSSSRQQEILPKTRES